MSSYPRWSESEGSNSGIGFRKSSSPRNAGELTSTIQLFGVPTPGSEGTGSVEPSATSEASAMIRNICCRFTQEDVEGILSEAGFSSKVSSVYVPLRGRSANPGYAFVKFVSQEA